MDILITNIKDYNLFCEEYDSKGIIWQSGHKLTDRNAPIYKSVVGSLSSGESIIISIHSDNRCTRIKESEFSYFNHIIEKGDYVLYSPANVNVNIVVV